MIAIDDDDLAAGLCGEFDLERDPAPVDGQVLHEPERDDVLVEVGILDAPEGVEYGLFTHGAGSHRVHSLSAFRDPTLASTAPVRYEPPPAICEQNAPAQVRRGVL